MSVIVIGLNHRTAPLSLLERTAISSSHLPKALHGLSEDENISGAIILSTCHRTEIYASAPAFHDTSKILKQYLNDLTFVGESELNKHLYSFTDTEVVSHLFCVVSGLDSAVLGEHEIQGQVKRAWEVAVEEKSTDSDLNQLFRHALETGKRIRTDTNILKRNLSISDAAVEMATAKLGTINGLKTVVLGTGEMGERISTLLSKGAVKDIAIASRTYKNANSLATSHSCRAIHLDEVTKELVEADLFFSSTGATNLLVERDEMEQVMKEREQRPLLMIDIAVPRDIDPLSSDLEGLTLNDIDDVRQYVASMQGESEKDMDIAQEILNEEVIRYQGLAQASKMSSFVNEFRRQICEISQDEFERYDSKLKSLEPEEREVVEELVRSIINKVLHNPSVAIQKVDDTTAERLVKALKELFKF